MDLVFGLPKYRDGNTGIAVFVDGIGFPASVNAEFARCSGEFYIHAGRKSVTVHRDTVILSIHQGVVNPGFARTTVQANKFLVLLVVF